MTTATPRPDRPAAPPPSASTWTYVVHTTAVIYGPGAWPFYHHTPPGPRAGHTVTPQPCPVRLAAGAPHAVHAEYVLAEPLPDGRALAHFHLNPPGAQQRHHPTPRYSVIIDPVRRMIDVTGARPDDLTSRALAEEKATRVLALLRAALAERDAGAKHPAAVASTNRQATR